MYMESIPKASYDEWKREKENRLSPVKPAASLDYMDSPTKKRHDIGYISENLESWTTRLADMGDPTNTFAQVQAATTSTGPTAVNYKRDGLEWRSDFRIFVVYDGKGTSKKSLTLHLPNDGFFYVAESLLPVLASGRVNDKDPDHRDGWAFLDQCLWPKLEHFEKYARKWFGYDEEKKLRRQVVYNDSANRMDISLLCPDTNVSIDFVFEPGFPATEVPDNFWF